MPDIVTMRAAATWFLDRRTPPGRGTVQALHRDLRGYLDGLIPWVLGIVRREETDEAQGSVALAAVAQARQRMGGAQIDELSGEPAHVTWLARSVLALCDHYDTLTGVTMCLVCDGRIVAGDDSLPFGRGGAGRVHTHCGTPGNLGAGDRAQLD
ncbi:DUF6415 family natural product biosynthesis protein [Streptomyces sp. NPDC023723]|uniref:DUF6415 family natural product biosynthesis protein n=1 Tax=Streptomyces sp. NPDC023723 TaxID=3154323 RepID=UPI0033C665EB